MDHSDGSKEARLISEALKFIVQLIQSQGNLEGNAASFIAKQIQKKGLSGNDFSFCKIEPGYDDQYHRYLMERGKEGKGIPYLKLPDIHGNSVLIVRSEDAAELLEVDAMIKKTSAKHNRALYVNEFLKNEQQLGNMVFKIDLKNQIIHDMIANKAFTSEAGFVTSYDPTHRCCYFSETAVNGSVATVLVDTALSSMQGTLLEKIKTGNSERNMGENIELREALAGTTPKYYVNSFDNTSTYVKICNNKIEIHSSKGAPVIIDTSNLGPESVTELLDQQIALIKNGAVLSSKEFSDYQKKSKMQLDADKEQALLTNAEQIFALSKGRRLGANAHQYYLASVTVFYLDERG